MQHFLVNFRENSSAFLEIIQYVSGKIDRKILENVLSFFSEFSDKFLENAPDMSEDVPVEYLFNFSENLRWVIWEIFLKLITRHKNYISGISGRGGGEYIKKFWMLPGKHSSRFYTFSDKFLQTVCEFVNIFKAVFTSYWKSACGS